jgi:predicted GIY-YIG superfamily endonuclease
LVGIGTVFGSLITGVSRNPSLRDSLFYYTWIDFSIKRKKITNSSIIPVKSYSNVEANKDLILQENYNKAGIYRFINNINGKSYIGSAVIINRRLNEHFRGDKSNIILQKAFNKYGLNNFSLQIFEYCESDKETLLKKEQFYLDIFQPEYNLSPTAASP